MEDAMQLILIAVAVLALVDGVIGTSNSTDSTNSTSLIDPINRFCQRVYHQSVLKNDALYIDGGLEVFAENSGGAQKSNPIIGYNEYLIAIAMNETWDWKVNLSVTALDKTADVSTGTYPPNNLRGALFAGAENDPNIYLYGGTVSWANRSAPGFQWPTAPTYSLWSYGSSTEAWKQYDVSLEVPDKPAGGAWTQAPDKGLAFYLNGFIDNGTNSNYAHFSNFRRYLDGMIVLNTTSQIATNLSTSSLDNYPRAMGGLAYVPNVGSEGVLVSMGGVTKPSSNSELSDLGTYVSFDSVDFLDVASIDNGASNGTWYTQATTGSVPAARTDFCLVVASAPDNSSHSIYMYGGRDKDQVYDQTYVLTIPSFTWIKLLEGISPRYGHTCHLVANSQMLTVGGIRYDSITKGCDWETKSVAILNLNNTQWGQVYDPDAGEYTLPSQIYNVIGGGQPRRSTGSASMAKPSDGFSNEAVATFFKQPSAVARNTTSATNVTSESGSNHLTGGQIAGVVVGSCVGVAFIIAGLVLLVIHRKRKQKGLSSSTEGQEEETDIHEAPEEFVPHRFAWARLRNPRRRTELPGASQVELSAESPTVSHELDSSVSSPGASFGSHITSINTQLAELPGTMSEEKKE
ncbi:Major facilitator superfamily domain general substrate transporter [Penicillium atrosanguineum]|uniref:Major facilitator superfamily domain general substrate transporter n=1 Tax=Penicillium atrosanguineum TaxID=1132637 RepID=UPI002392E078|nr:Major facilitator superfamily domain general substrate transporter [Penicillium atrosanguineum]KAJ5314466.1 Major facilitator superfamily domain general substrate transporter [Penicillium atrosanguineum]